MKLSELATLTTARVEKEYAELEIVGAAGLEDAKPGQVTFLSNPRYTPKVNSTLASAIYLGEDTHIEKQIPILRARDPYLAFTRALRVFHPEPKISSSVHATAVVDPSAQIANDVWIGAFTIVGAGCQIAEGARIHSNVTIYDDVKIGKDSLIHAGVVIRERSRIGDRVIIHNNVVVGCDGFGYAKDEDNHWLKIPQTGRVVIEDDVEIGAGTTIDRASTGETRIERGTKIDNLVQIGHSCKVGEDTLICAQVGLAGSTQVGKRVILTGQVGVAGHLTIGNDTVITPQSGVANSVGAGKLMSGSPAIDHRDWLRAAPVFRKLGDIPRVIRTLQTRLEALEKALFGDNKK